MNLPLFFAWGALICGVVGIGFVIWFILSPKELSENAPILSVSVEDKILRPHGMDYIYLRVTNPDPAITATNFKAEIASVENADVWAWDKFPLALNPANPDVNSISAGGNELVVFLSASVSEKHEGEKIFPMAYISIESKLPKHTHGTTTMGICSKQPFKAGDKFAFSIRVTAGGFGPLNAKLIYCLSPDGKGLKLSAKVEL